jgi:hypothetical protein
MPVNVDCSGRVIIDAAIGHCGVRIQGGCDHACIEFVPGRPVRAAVKVVTSDVARSRRVPTQVHDMVGARLDDDFVRHLRSASMAPVNLHREGVDSCGRRRSSEVQRGRSAGRFCADTGGQGSGCNRPLVGSASTARLDYCRIWCTDGSIGAGKWSLWQQCRGSACREGAAGGVCKSSQPYAAELVQIPVSHRGSQTSASFFLTATNSATSVQRHRSFRPNHAVLNCRKIPMGLRTHRPSGLAGEFYSSP